jgi:hypothetical protein
MSPELAAQMSEVPPHHFVPGRGYEGSLHSQHNGIDTEGSGSGRVRIQSSPGEAPWSPGGFGLINGPTQVQYAQVPNNYEMGGEGVVSPGIPSPGYVQNANTQMRREQIHELG